MSRHKTLFKTLLIAAAILTLGGASTAVAGDFPSNRVSISFDGSQSSWGGYGKGHHPQHSKPYRVGRSHYGHKGGGKHYYSRPHGGYGKKRRGYGGYTGLFFFKGTVGPYYGQRHYRAPRYPAYTLRPSCQEVERVYYIDGRKALVGGIACPDAYGNFYILPESRFVIGYYD
ncbi:MAG: hypothetical protein AAF530_02475 [Pseudomonadota bacterium]